MSQFSLLLNDLRSEVRKREILLAKSDQAHQKLLWSLQLYENERDARETASLINLKIPTIENSWQLETKDAMCDRSAALKSEFEVDLSPISGIHTEPRGNYTSTEVEGFSTPRDKDHEQSLNEIAKVTRESKNLNINNQSAPFGFFATWPVNAHSSDKVSNPHSVCVSTDETLDFALERIENSVVEVHNNLNLAQAELLEFSEQKAYERSLYPVVVSLSSRCQALRNKLAALNSKNGKVASHSDAASQTFHLETLDDDRNPSATLRILHCIESALRITNSYPQIFYTEELRPFNSLASKYQMNMNHHDGLISCGQAHIYMDSSESSKIPSVVSKCSPQNKAMQGKADSSNSDSKARDVKEAVLARCGEFFVQISNMRTYVEQIRRTLIEDSNEIPQGRNQNTQVNAPVQQASFGRSDDLFKVVLSIPGAVCCVEPNIGVADKNPPLLLGEEENASAEIMHIPREEITPSIPGTTLQYAGPGIQSMAATPFTAVTVNLDAPPLAAIGQGGQIIMVHTRSEFGLESNTTVHSDDVARRQGLQTDSPPRKDLGMQVALEYHQCRNKDKTKGSGSREWSPTASPLARPTSVREEELLPFSSPSSLPGSECADSGRVPAGVTVATGAAGEDAAAVCQCTRTEAGRIDSVSVADPRTNAAAFLAAHPRARLRAPLLLVRADTSTSGWPAWRLSVPTLPVWPRRRRPRSGDWPPSNHRKRPRPHGKSQGRSRSARRNQPMSAAKAEWSLFPIIPMAVGLSRCRS